MVDPRESLGDFDSSIFDASDGHKLVDLIRRKKGLNVQTHKIFDDVPTNRPSLHIEIQRLDKENETLKPAENIQEPKPATVAIEINREIPPTAEFVPKSPKRPSARRSITSPIIKMSSTTLGRRTLLKEFERAFANESRFLPEICSTPINSDLPNKINHSNKNVAETYVVGKKSSKENIICSPITISDEGSPVEQLQNSLQNSTLNENFNTNENAMRSLLNQNEILNALLEQSQKQSDDTLVNREEPSRKSPRRTFTVEYDISNGKITLSPSKSRQNNEKDPKAFTKKLTSTSEQLKVFNRLGLGLAKATIAIEGQKSIQKSSRIPLPKNPPASIAPVLGNQETTTAEFVERLQKNATPNCPVIVIPVNQTFNQAAVDRTIPNDISHHETSPFQEITSTNSNNNPKALDCLSKQIETHRRSSRVDSPVHNIISSTTISNDEQPEPEPEREREPPPYNLRWEDILTDDASNSDKSDCEDRKTGKNLKSDRRKVSITAQKKNKVPLSNQCPNYSEDSYNSDQTDEEFASGFLRRQAAISDEQSVRKGVQNKRRETFQVDKQCKDVCTNYMLQQPNREGSDIKERQDKPQEQKSRQYCDEDRENNFPQQSQPEPSKRDELRCKQRETIETQKSPTKTSKIGEKPAEKREKRLTRRANRESLGIFDNHCTEEHENNFPQQSQQKPSNRDELRCKQSETIVPQECPIKTSKIGEKLPEKREKRLTRRTSQESLEVFDDQCNEEHENNFPQQSQPEPSNRDKIRCKQSETIVPQKSPVKTSKIVEKIPEKREKRLTRRTSQESLEVFDDQCNEEHENNFPQQSQPEPSNRDELRYKQRETVVPQKSPIKTSKIVEKLPEKREKRVTRRASQESLEVFDDQCNDEHENNFPQQSQQEPSNRDGLRCKQRETIVPQKSPIKTSKIVEKPPEKCDKRLTRRASRESLEVVEKLSKKCEQNIPPQSIINEHRRKERSRRDISSIDKEISQLRRTIEGNNNDIESFQNLPPPLEFRDEVVDSNSISAQKDLVDELSTDRVILSQDSFKRPSEVIGRKKRRKIKAVPENVKEYLDVNQQVVKTRYLNVSKRKLYSKGNSDLESSDDASFSIKSKKNRSTTKQLERSRKSRKSSKSVSNRNVVNKERETPKKDISIRDPGFGSYQKQQSESLSTTRNVSRSISRRGFSPSKSDLNESTPKTINQGKNSRKSSKSKSNITKKDAESKVEEHEERVTRALLLGRRSSESNSDQTSNPPSPPKTINRGKKSRNSNKSTSNITKKDVESKVEQHEKRVTRALLLGRRSSESNSDQSSNLPSPRKRNSSNSSRSRSPPKKTKVQDSNFNKNSRKIKVNNKDFQGNLEEYSTLSTSKSHSKATDTSPAKTLEPPEESNSHMNYAVTEVVESNPQKSVPAPVIASAPAQPKTRTKKISKKNKNSSPVPSTKYVATSTTNSQNPDGGLRRSTREKKLPTAYWACTDSQFTHVFDIYNMLTAGRKPYFPDFMLKPKTKKKNTSTDENLVANTNEVDSSSNKNKIKTKQQSKNTNKKLSKQSGSTTETGSGMSSSSGTSVSSECSLMQQPSTEEKQTSTVKSPVKTKSRIKPKSKLKPKDKLGKSNNSEKDASSDVPNSKYSSNGLSTDPSLSDDTDFSSVQKRRLTTITEDAQTHLNYQRTSNILMPPPETNFVKKVNKTRKKNTFHTEHDDSIAYVSSVHVNNLFDQLKNSSINCSTMNRSRLAMNSSEQVSLDSRNNKTKNSSKSGDKPKNVSVNLRRLNLQHEGPYDISEKHFDSGFSSEGMNSENTRKDILLDWLVQILNNGKTPSNKQTGLAKLLKPTGFEMANVDELTFEEIDGVDFAFYNTPGQKFGYLRFKPRTQKKLSYAKRYELNFVLLGGIIEICVDGQTFDMKNGDLFTIFIGTSYGMKNRTDDPALVMVIRK